MDELTQYTSPDNNETAKDDTANLSEKSRETYMQIYQKFMDWRQKTNTTSFSENVMMAYFSELALTRKPSTLWARYSMLKSTLSIHNNIDIQKYTKLNAFLKQTNVGFKSKTTKVFTTEEVDKFLNEAPDHQYLVTKVAMIFGINGACRREEMCQIQMKDVKDFENSLILVNLPPTKKHIKRSFTITDKFYQIVKQYMALRPKICKCDRFFLNFHCGKCTQQPIGIHKFGMMPKMIATFLNLPEPELYTGHCFRRTSAKLLADAGADLSTLKQHLRLRSNLVAEDYIVDSKGNRSCNRNPDPSHVCETKEDEKLHEEYQNIYDSSFFIIEFKNWNNYTSEEQASLVDRYFDWLTLANVEEIKKAKTVSKIFKMKEPLPEIANHPLLVKRLLAPHKNMGAIFSISTYIAYVKPLIIELYKSREIKVRLKLLECLIDHVEVFTDKEMKAHIIPEIGIGLQEVDKSIVRATLLCLSKLVDILGPAAVIGGTKHEKFVDSQVDSRNKATLEAKTNGDNLNLESSKNVTALEEMEVEIEDYEPTDPLDVEENKCV